MRLSGLPGGGRIRVGRPGKTRPAWPWRGAGAADRAGLENRCGSNPTEGSNPSLSARERTGPAMSCSCKDLRGPLFSPRGVVKTFVKTLSWGPGRRPRHAPQAVAASLTSRTGTKAAGVALVQLPAPGIKARFRQAVPDTVGRHRQATGTPSLDQAPPVLFLSTVACLALGNGDILLCGGLDHARQERDSPDPHGEPGLSAR